MAEHLVVKPQKLAAAAVGFLEQELLVPRLFQKESIDRFKGAEDDTVSVKVEGVLPFHDYAWRNDRSQPIKFDDYKERKFPVTFGGNVYSGVRSTDEQLEFDLFGWSKLLRPQVKAVARGLGRRAVSLLTNQQYNVTVGNAERNLRGAIVEARRVLNKFNVPNENRYLLVGTDFESALLNDDKLNLAQNVGDDESESSLRNATIGRRSGFNIVVDQTIPSDAAYAFAGAGFIFLNAAPEVPASVPFGATQSFEGISMRWMRDYHPDYFWDRSIVNTYAGFRSITDVLVGWDPAKEAEFVSETEYFVRGIKLLLDGASDYPAAGSELARITGISDAKVWTPTGPKPETDPANA
ncbi:hypothetical protein [Kribbella deserti]|uniref:Major capsid protein n=1 Tax=Kribbella deserti TaxID=1926257 RepID=A0ABV6QGV0_9ACTN